MQKYRLTARALRCRWRLITLSFTRRPRRKCRNDGAVAVARPTAAINSYAREEDLQCKQSAAVHFLFRFLSASFYYREKSDERVAQRGVRCRRRHLPSVGTSQHECLQNQCRAALSLRPTPSWESRDVPTTGRVTSTKPQLT